MVDTSFERIGEYEVVLDWVVNFLKENPTLKATSKILYNGLLESSPEGFNKNHWTSTMMVAHLIGRKGKKYGIKSSLLPAKEGNNKFYFLEENEANFTRKKEKVKKNQRELNRKRALDIICLKYGISRRKLALELNTSFSSLFGEKDLPFKLVSEIVNQYVLDEVEKKLLNGETNI